MVGGQIRGSLPDRFQGIVAYEPVWAIGTGRFATEADVAAMHGDRTSGFGAPVRRRSGRVGSWFSYGGSVNAANAAGLLGVPEVGARTSGARDLKAHEFLSIIRSARAS